LKQDNVVFCIMLSMGMCVLWLLHAGGQPVRAAAASSPSFRGAVPSLSFDPLSADVRTLRLLPGIGPKLARTLHHQSRVLQLDSLDQLERIDGIGPTRARNIRDAVVHFEDNAADVP
jgi:predicted flap endonuclease-1-like 5' DNA nuclease